MNSLNRRDALKSGLFGAAAAAGTMLGPELPRPNRPAKRRITNSISSWSVQAVRAFPQRSKLLIRAPR